MDKAIQLQMAYMKNDKIGLFDWKSFYKEINLLGLEIEHTWKSPYPDLMLEFNENPDEKEEYENIFNDHNKYHQWNIFETKAILSEDKPHFHKKRLLAELTFKYSFHFNEIEDVQFRLIDSRVWEVLVHGGDGGNFKFKEIEGHYIITEGLQSGIYTKAEFGYHMDFDEHDGALMVTKKFSNNLMTDNILDATYNQDIERIESLIQEGKNIEEKNQFGQTALMVAVERFYVNCIEKLLNHGANINAKDNDGLTVFDYVEKIKSRPYAKNGIDRINQIEYLLKGKMNND